VFWTQVLEHELYQQWCDESGSDNSLPTVEIGVEANRLQQTPTARAAFNAVHDICTVGPRSPYMCLISIN